MSSIRFHHVFFALMLLALISAFVLSPERSRKLQPRVESLFAPIAAPLRTLGASIERKWGTPEKVDQRGDQAIRDENQALRIANANLQAQLDDLKIVAGDVASLGDVGKHARMYKVIAADAGNSEALSIAGSSLNGLAEGQPVVYKGGLAGQVLRTGVTSTKILLITDRSAKAMTAMFGTFQNDADGLPQFNKRPMAPALVQGAGNNSLIANFMTLKDVEASGIKIGDWCVLEDQSWPPLMQGYLIGQVTAIGPRPDSPLFARVLIEPPKKLRLLEDVSVVLK